MNESFHYLLCREMIPNKCVVFLPFQHFMIKKIQYNEEKIKKIKVLDDLLKKDAAKKKKSKADKEENSDDFN